METPVPRRPRLRSRIASGGFVAVLALSAALTAGTAYAAPDTAPDWSNADLVGAGSMHRLGIDGAGVTVVVIDTGIEPRPELDGMVVHQVNFSDSPAVGDQFGHGTFVAGLLHDVAPGARIISLKLSGADGAVDVTQVIAALQWVVINQQRWSIDVVNLSFGNDSTQSPDHSPLNFAVQRVWDAGIVVVASVGNDTWITKPADDPLVISVGASDHLDTPDGSDDVTAAFTPAGPTVWGVAKPDVVAPGARIVSLRNPGSTIDRTYPAARVGIDGFRGSGTSFSAPLVTGAAALLLQLSPRTTPDQVKHLLAASAQPVIGPAAAQGSGAVSAERAAAYLGRGVDDHANRLVRRSTGRGSISGARGRRTRVWVSQPTADPAVASTSATSSFVSPEVAMPVDSFEPDQFLVDGSWDASRWGASRWGTSRWGASRWGSMSWDAGAAGSTEWWASRWG